MVFARVKNVLVGHSANGSIGVSPVGALMRLRRFSFANTIAPCGRSDCGLLPPPPILGRRRSGTCQPARRHRRIHPGDTKLLVAAVVILVRRRVDDVVDRTVRKGMDGLEDLVAHLRGSGIDEQHALGADLYGDVAGSTGNHEDVALDGEHCERVARRQRNASRARLRLLLAPRLNHQVRGTLLRGQTQPHEREGETRDRGRSSADHTGPRRNISRSRRLPLSRHRAVSFRGRGGCSRSSRSIVFTYSG
jgi:hypothetical protein